MYVEFTQNSTEERPVLLQNDKLTSYAFIHTWNISQLCICLTILLCKFVITTNATYPVRLGTFLVDLELGCSLRKKEQVFIMSAV